MSECIEFFCPGEVKGKGNSKSIVRSKSGRVFLVEPKKNRANAMTLAALFAQHAPAKPLEGPVRVTYQIQFPWRKSDSKKVRAAGAGYRNVRPDLGQLEKQIDDACQAAGLIVDDSQICVRGETTRAPWLVHGKFTCDSPGVHVRIETL